MALLEGVACQADQSTEIPDQAKSCNILSRFMFLCLALIAGTMGEKVRHPRCGFKEDEFGNLEVTQAIPGDFKSFPRASLLVLKFSHFLGSFCISRRLSEQP